MEGKEGGLGAGVWMAKVMFSRFAVSIFFVAFCHCWWCWCCCAMNGEDAMAVGVSVLVVC